MNRNIFDMVVIGAGMVGVCSALWLQRKGHFVALVDRQDPGQGSSYGNAGVFADYACHALNDSSIFAKLPATLFGKDHPVGMLYPQIFTMLPWFMQFLINCRPKRAAEIARAIEYICRHAKEGLVPLLESADAGELIEKRGVLQLYQKEADFLRAKAEIDMLAQRQYRACPVTPADVAELEPNIKLPFYKGVFYEDAWNLLNPAGLVQRLAMDFAARGGQVIKLEIDRIAKRPEGGLRLVAGQQHLDTGQAILAAGAFSTKIKGTGAERLPLDTERGYHLMFDQAHDLVTRPVGWIDSGIFVSPIRGGIRAAGTVEFGGTGLAKTASRLHYIQRCAWRMLPDLQDMEISSDWLGHRPTLPDSLPVIGRTREIPEVILAFGHQHLGMTLGGITGKLISEIADKEKSSLDLSAFSPDRFGF